jgi:Tol biopolymer transport system component
MNRAPFQPSPFASQVEVALTHLNSSPEFVSSDQLRRLLAFLIKRTLEGRQDELKETVIGVEVFGRDPGYDPKLDGVVRTEARRLRFKLTEYYDGSGRDQALIVALPKGGYVPEFHPRTQPEAPADPVSNPAPAEFLRSRRYSYWLAAIALAMAALGFSISRARLQPPVARVPRLLNIGLPIVRAPVFSPDGQHLLFSVDDRQSHIWIHDLSAQINRQVTSGEVRDYVPCWSPDGGRVAFLRRTTMEINNLLILDLETGRTRTLGTVAQVLPIDWSRDGRFIAVSDGAAPGGSFAIFLINVETGARRQITSPPASMLDAEPRFSWSGRKIVFARRLGDSMRDSVNDLYLQPLKASLEPDGQPVRLTSDKQTVKGFAWSADDQSVIASMKRGRLTRSLWRVPLDGAAPEHLPESGIEPLNPALSPKTSQLAYINLIQDTNIWRVGHDEGPLIQSNRGDTGAQISPDNRWIVFRSSRSGSDGIWLAQRDGTAARMLSDCAGFICGDARWAPDSKRIAFDSAQAGSADIYILSIDQPNPVRFTVEAENELVPNWSHDGKSIYFASNRSGSWQVWRKPVAGGIAEQITGDGGFAAAEDSSGRFMYFSKQRGGKGIWRIPLTGGSEELVIPNMDNAMWGSWALTPGGIYFIDYDPVTASGPGQIEFYDFATRARSPVAKTGRMPVMWDLSLAAAPNGSDLLYSQLDRGGTEVFLIDHFR